MSELGEKVAESMIMTKILITLPSEFDHFSTAWHSTAVEERTLNNLISQLTMEEIRKGMRDSNVSGDALAAKRYHGQNDPKNKHDEGRKGMDSPRCNYCKKPGPWMKDCRILKSKKRANNTSTSKSAPNESHQESIGGAFIREVVLATPRSTYSRDVWYLDSGASSHMTGKKEWFSSLVRLNQNISIKVGNGKLIEAEHEGCMNTLIFDGKTWSKRSIENVLYLPELNFNLLSMTSILEKGFQVGATTSGCKIEMHGQTVGVADIENRLSVMKLKVVMPKVYTSSNECALVNIKQPLSLQEWHKKLAHQNYDHVKRFSSLKGIPVVGQREECQPCIRGKMHRKPHPHSTTVTSEIGEIVHTDMNGLMAQKSLNNSRYLLLFRDDYSHYRKVYNKQGKSLIQ